MFKFLKFKLKSFLLVDLLRGLKVTLKNLFKKKVTVYYPEEKAPKSVRFRGLHALRRYKNGEERCIACKLCESVCPALAITIESSADYAGIRRTTRYDIDLFKCVYCGLCEEACPVSAIVQTNISDFHYERKNDAIIRKEQLLLLGDKYETDIIESVEGRL